MNYKKAFTLAEVMIVLVVIGILTGILVPAAMNSMPNENVMKFKKAHNTLYRVINELVSSDKYYADGDLGIRPNGDLIDGTHSGDRAYFCNTFADLVSTKNTNCDSVSGTYSVGMINTQASNNIPLIDTQCKSQNNSENAQIVTSDGISFYQANPKLMFGQSIYNVYLNSNSEYFIQAAQGGNSEEQEYLKSIREFGGYLINGFDVIYMGFCIDIDGIGKGEDPFGYGIRADGKILTGARADEWLNKSIQEKEQ